MSRVSKSRAGIAALCASTLMLVGTANAHAAIAITSPVEEAYTNDLTPTVTFTGAEPLEDVDLEVGDDVVGTVGADGAGAGTVTATTAVADGPREKVALVVRDFYTAFAMVQVNVDQVPSLSGPADGTTHRAAAIEYTVMDAIPGNDVVLYDGLVEVDREPADNDGKVAELKPTTPLSPGTHTLKAVTVDDAGVESSPNTFTLDVDPPPAGFTDLFDNVQLNQRQPTLRLDNVYAAASAVTLYELDGNGDLVVIPSTSVVGINGTGTITPTLAGALSDGEHALIVTQTVNGVETDDDQGYLPATQVFVNTSAPTLSSNDDGKLTNEIPYFNVDGALKSYSDNTNTVELYIDDVLAGSDGTDGGGAAGIRPTTLADGTHTAYVVTVDDLGNRSTVRSNEVTFTLDATAPAAPTFVSPANGAVLATSQPQVTVNAEPGTLVHVLVDDVGEENWQTTDANGHATFALSQAFADGAHYVTVFAEDAAGNFSDYATSAFTVSTAVTPPPVTPTPPAPPAAPPTAPKNQADLDGDGIENTWLVNGKAAAAPRTPKAVVSSSGVKLTLPKAPKGAKSVRVYRADGNGGFKLVKTLKAGSKAFTDSKVKAGHTYKYKTVAVNAKGQQGKASGTATAKVKQK